MNMSEKKFASKAEQRRYESFQSAVARTTCDCPDPNDCKWGGPACPEGEKRLARSSGGIAYEGPRHADSFMCKKEPDKTSPAARWAAKQSVSFQSTEAEKIAQLEWLLKETQDQLRHDQAELFALKSAQSSATTDDLITFDNLRPRIPQDEVGDFELSAVIARVRKLLRRESTYSATPRTD